LLRISPSLKPIWLSHPFGRLPQPSNLTHRCLAHDGLLLGSAGADQVADDYKACCDADPGLEGRMCLQAAHGIHQLQPRAYRPLCIVFMRLRIAKVDQDPSPMYFATKPPKRCTASATHF
jgi:hypothetical protein